MANLRDSVRLEVANVASDRDAPDNEAEPNTVGWNSEGWPTAAIYVEADSESSTATVRPWYWSGEQWCKGSLADITGSTVVTIDSLGSYVYIQLISVSGTFTVRYQRMDLED